MGIVMGDVVSLNIIGKWSEDVVGPCIIVWLWYVCWLASIISGVVCELWLMNVGKLGPRWTNLFVLMSMLIPFPTVLEVRLLRHGCLAFRSPRMYVGSEFDARRWKSVMGKKGLRGGRYVVAICIGPVVVCTVIWRMSVSKLLVILCLMLVFISTALPSCSSLFVLAVYVV